MVIELEVLGTSKAFALDWYRDDDKYTDIGQTVYNIKYVLIPNHQLTVKELNEELDYLASALLPFTEGIDMILPVPSFNPQHYNNPDGDLKMMYMLADRLGEISGKNVGFSILEKCSEKQAKDSRLRSSDYVSKRLPNHVRNVLLIDDLFGEGNTAKYTVSALKKMNPDVLVRFISLTKNKYGGIPKRYSCRISKFEPYHPSDNYDDSIDLYFKVDGRNEKVRIWENHPRYDNVKIAYEKGRLNDVFEFSIYKNQRGFWQIADD